MVVHTCHPSQHSAVADGGSEESQGKTKPESGYFVTEYGSSNLPVNCKFLESDSVFCLISPSLKFLFY